MLEEVGKQNPEMTTIIALACSTASVWGGKWGPLVATARPYRVSRHFIWEREQEKTERIFTLLIWESYLASLKLGAIHLLRISNV